MRLFVVAVIVVAVIYYFYIIIQKYILFYIYLIYCFLLLLQCANASTTCVGDCITSIWRVCRRRAAGNRRVMHAVYSLPLCMCWFSNPHCDGRSVQDMRKGKGYIVSHHSSFLRVWFPNKICQDITHAHHSVYRPCVLPRLQVSPAPLEVVAHAERRFTHCMPSHSLFLRR